MLQVEGQNIGVLKCYVLNSKDEQVYMVRVLMHDDSIHKVIAAQRLSPSECTTRQMELLSFLEDMVPDLCWYQNKVRLPEKADVLGWVFHHFEKEED